MRRFIYIYTWTFEKRSIGLHMNFFLYTHSSLCAISYLSMFHQRRNIFLVHVNSEIVWESFAWPVKSRCFAFKWRDCCSVIMCESSRVFHIIDWVVISNIFYFHPYLGKISNLTNIFQRGWNHQLVEVLDSIIVSFQGSRHNPRTVQLRHLHSSTRYDAGQAMLTDEKGMITLQEKDRVPSQIV